MYSISKEFSFEYSHRLSLPYDSPCTAIHGHSGRVIVELSSNKLDEQMMIIDFTELKSIKQDIDFYLDHATILNKNDPLVEILEPYAKLYLVDGNPTAELFANEIATKFIKDKYQFIPLSVIKVTVYETAKNCASKTIFMENNDG